jgi:capsule polysaccharide export protein KpsC/LpsZ
VRVIASTSELNSYDVIAESDVVLTYTSTVGLEAAATGTRAAVAGICHYRGKGFTNDVGGRDDLAQIIANPQPMADTERELARRYAYLFFVRMMIPFPAVEREGLRTAAMADDAAALGPEGDEWVDWVCARILDGQPFVR